jgi:hypothetical protein
MIRRTRTWLIVGVVFIVANLGGAGMAASAGEVQHASVHLALTLAGAFLVWALVAGRRAGRERGRSGPVPAMTGVFGDRLTNLEQSVDAVAIEVERIGEGQRFMTRLFTENAPQPEPSLHADDPAELDPPRTPSDGRPV